MKRQSKRVLIFLGIIFIFLLLLGFSIFLLMRNNFASATQATVGLLPHLVNSNLVKQSAIQSGECYVDLDAGYSYCCDDGMIFCDDTYTICGSSQSWCDNYLNGDPKLCNGDICCSGSNIIDYTYNKCCPSTAPYYMAPYRNGCMPNMGGWGGDDWNQYSQCIDGWCLFGDNYYTQNSECTQIQEGYPSYTIPNSVKCEGTTYFLCNRVSDYIFKWNDQGVILGKCGAECNNNEEKCEELDYFICNNNIWSNQGEQIGKCGANCKSGVKEYLTCSEGFIPDNFIKRTCTNGNWIDTISTCFCAEDSQEICKEGYECKDTDCIKIKEKTNWILYISIGVIILFIIGIIIFAIRRKK